ncbi:MAG: 50S ribosome-binding GTPase [Phycisphaerales bacterium]|nr:MAG: 50S ribosome-binding GTPase [Phycisphaerales bacterium]
MSLFAAVMTGKGTAAISTIQVFGGTADALISKIFKAVGSEPVEFRPGTISLGTICENNETIDQVTIGCEDSDCFAINCHGNPLIVSGIMQLLGRHGVTLLTAEQLLAKILLSREPNDTIAVEAKLAQLKAKTIQGTKIIANQVKGGLSERLKQWRDDIDTKSLEEISGQIDKILTDSLTAKLIITGCSVAIAGPPNTGKSTLLNCLAGRQKAIVTDIRGTTRDWVSAQCQIGPLSAELIDTAGLDEGLLAGTEHDIEKATQQKTAEVMERANLILVVLDSSQSASQVDAALPGTTTDKRVVTVLNKSDLPTVLNANQLPRALQDAVRISAKFGTGVEELRGKVQQVLGVADFDLQSTVCFTERQEDLLRELRRAKSRQQAASTLTELLNGKLAV